MLHQFGSLKKKRAKEQDLLHEELNLCLDVPSGASEVNSLMGFEVEDYARVCGMESSSTLFEKIVPVRVTKCNSEDRHMDLTARFVMGLSKVHRTTKVLQVQITNELDPFFFYSLEVNEDDFQSLKVEQCILVDFSSFPYKFIELLEQCIVSASSDNPRFLAILHIRTGDSTFTVVETNQFKHLSHLSLVFRQGNDTVIKQFLAGRLAEYKSINGDMHEKLRRTLHSLEKALRDANSFEQPVWGNHVKSPDNISELGELKENQCRAISELKAEYTLELAHEKEKVMHETAELKDRIERERGDSEYRLRQQIDSQQERASELDKQVRTLLDTKYKLDTRVTDLRTKFVTVEKDLDDKIQECERLRRENRSLDTEKHEGAKQLNRHLIRLSALEQEVSDKNEILSNLTMQLEAQASHSLKRDILDCDPLGRDGVGQTHMPDRFLHASNLKPMLPSILVLGNGFEGGQTMPDPQEFPQTGVSFTYQGMEGLVKFCEPLIDDMSEHRRAALEGSWKEAQTAADRAEERATASSAEISKCYQIIEKLQVELRSAKQKVKLKGQVTTQQDSLLTERQATIEKVQEDNHNLRRELSNLKEEQDENKKKAEEVSAKLEEAQDLVKSNQQMIQWLNQQLTEAQLGKLGSTASSRYNTFTRSNNNALCYSSCLTGNRPGEVTTPLSSNSSLGGMSASTTFKTQFPSMSPFLVSTTAPFTGVATSQVKPQPGLTGFCSTPSLAGSQRSMYVPVAKTTVQAAQKVQYKPKSGLTATSFGMGSNAQTCSYAGCTMPMDSPVLNAWDDSGSWGSKQSILPRPQLSFADRSGYSKTSNSLGKGATNNSGGDCCHSNCSQPVSPNQPSPCGRQSPPIPSSGHSELSGCRDAMPIGVGGSRDAVGGGHRPQSPKTKSCSVPGGDDWQRPQSPTCNSLPASRSPRDARMNSSPPLQSSTKGQGREQSSSPSRSKLKSPPNRSPSKNHFSRR